MNDESLCAALDGSPVTIMAVDRDLRYLWVHNPQSGFRAEDIVGKRDDEIFSPDVAQSFIDVKQVVLANEAPVRHEFELTWHGIYARYDMHAEPLCDHDGAVIGISIVMINITEHARYEERAKILAEASELLSSSLDYETTLQQVANSMVPKLADWCSVDILSEDEGIVQVAVAHAEPAKIEWARSWRQQHPPSLDDSRGLAHVLRTGESEFHPEIPPALMEEAVRNAQTEEQRLVLKMIGFKSLIIVPLITRDQILGAITLVWSDSDRRYDEADLAFVQELARRAATAVDHAWLYRESQVRSEELRLLNETLEQQVEERTRELQRSNQDLDQFAYIASHDLKAPLRAVDHLSTWVMEDVGHTLPQRSHEHLQKMRNRIQRMEGLLDDLLTYSRAGRYPGEVTVVDMNELVARVIDTVAPPDSFTISVQSDLPTLRTHAVPLETVLRNLVSNAIKHHHKPTGYVHISATKGQGVADQIIEFAVADNGPGIDPAFHDRIFQMFQTLRPRDQIEGSGIGLAVVEKIVTGVGGQIRLKSKPNKGATFYFTWPGQVDS